MFTFKNYRVEATATFQECSNYDGDEAESSSKVHDNVISHQRLLPRLNTIVFKQSIIHQCDLHALKQTALKDVSFHNQ